MRKLLHQIETFKSFLTSLQSLQSNYLLSLNQVKFQFTEYFAQNNEQILHSSLSNMHSLLKNIRQILLNVFNEFNNKILSVSFEYINATHNDNILNSIEQTETTLRVIDKQVHKAKKTYYEALEYVEEKSIEHEIGQSIKTNKTLQRAIEIAKEKEEIYKEKINLYNNHIDSLHNEIEHYHLFYKSYILFEKQQYEKIIRLYHKTFNQLSTVVDTLLTSMSNINQDNNNNNNNSSNKDVHFNMKLFSHMSFEEYVPTLIEQNEVDLNRKQKLLLNIQKYFKIKINNNIKESKEDIEFYNHLKTLFSSDLSDTNCVYENITSKYLMSRYYREKFLSFVNRKRGKESNINKEEVFNILLKVFNFLFTQMTITNEYSNIKYLLLLSQSFYYFNPLTNKKVFIEDGLKMNETLCNEEYWIQFIEKAIKHETYNGHTNIFFPFYVNIINMVEFVKCKAKVMKVIEHFLEKYKYNDKEKEDIMEEVQKNLKLLEEKANNECNNN